MGELNQGIKDPLGLIGGAQEKENGVMECSVQQWRRQIGIAGCGISLPLEHDCTLSELM